MVSKRHIVLLSGATKEIKLSFHLFPMKDETMGTLLQNTTIRKAIKEHQDVLKTFLKGLF